MRLPERLRDKLSQNQNVESAVLGTISAFEPWLRQNRVVFFPEYTDHSVTHIESVLETASSLISDQSWAIISAADVAALIVATLLHDAGLHLTKEGFQRLVGDLSSTYSTYGTRDRSWASLWDDFQGEATRFDGRKLFKLFGNTDPIQRLQVGSSDWHERDFLLVGEFLRRHHARLAHEIAVFGVPGPGDSPIRIQGFDEDTANLIGLVARSHGISLRSAVNLLAASPRLNLREYRGIHAVYLMALLRISDYLQVESERAPSAVLRVQRLRSPVSQGEWAAHHAVSNVTNTHDDPEALLIEAHPEQVATFLRLRQWLSGIQTELDASWAVLGEVYGRFGQQNLDQLGLVIRRVRSNLDDLEAFAQTVPYLPRQAAFQTADAELLTLLIGPLYGDNPRIGIRELIQNAVDAVRELDDFLAHHPDVNAERPIQEVDVAVTVEKDSNDQWWLKVSDRGIGMTEEIICEYFLRAGASYRRSDAWKQTFEDSQHHSRVLRSGRFGVGALAAFLLGKEIVVSSRHVNSPPDRGIEFRASIESESIELRFVCRPVGTTIRIPLSKSATAPKRPHCRSRFRDNAAVTSFRSTCDLVSGS